jgi:hypothetical protein
VQRRTLLVAVVTLAAIGIAITAATVAKSLLPSESSQARSVFQRDLPAPGTSFQVDSKSTRLIVIRTEDGVVHAFAVPLRAGRVPWPDGPGWSRSGGCETFGVVPDPMHLTSSSVIRCTGNQDPTNRDVDWDLSGRVLTLGSFGKTQLPEGRVEVIDQHLRISIWDRS